LFDAKSYDGDLAPEEGCEYSEEEAATGFLLSVEKPGELDVV
jgi:hypothetical protein